MVVIWVLAGFHGGYRLGLRLGFWGWVIAWLEVVGAGLVFQWCRSDWV